MIRNGFRNTVAIVMLAILLPVFTVLPFHHHDSPEQLTASCEQCNNHLPHHGHLTTGWNLDNCLICQFLGISYVPSQSLDAPQASGPCISLAGEHSAQWHSAPIHLLTARAPPSLF